MKDRKPRILLIEDDPDHAELIREFLLCARTFSCSLERVSDLSSGLDRLAGGGIDLFLLDLGLPDSQGLETFQAARTAHPEIPVIVLTGLNDEGIGIEAVRKGAQDFLYKEEIVESRSLLVRAVRYAIERNRLEKELQASQQRETRERNLAEAVRGYQHYLAMANLPSAERAIRQSPPFRENLEKLMPEYRRVVLNYVRAIRMQEQPPSEQVRVLARDLSGLGARAKDVVRLHLGVLNEFSQRATPDQDRVFSNDARLALVELFGNMIDRYREMRVKP